MGTEGVGTEGAEKGVAGQVTTLAVVGWCGIAQERESLLGPCPGLHSRMIIFRSSPLRTHAPQDSPSSFSKIGVYGEGARSGQHPSADRQLALPVSRLGVLLVRQRLIQVGTAFAFSFRKQSRAWNWHSRTALRSNP
jgi:hypothetical protein